MSFKLDKSKCVKCGGCVSVCPKDALKLNTYPECDSEKCVECGICERFCPAGAIKVVKDDKK